MSCVTHMNKSCNINNLCHAYEWGMLRHIWMSHVTHVTESCHTYEWVMSHIWICHGLTYEWFMSHTWMSRVISIFTCVTWIINNCRVISVNIYRVVLYQHGRTRIKWIMHMITINTYRVVLYQLFMSYIWMRHASSHMNESCHTSDWIVSHIWMGHVTHMNESCQTHKDALNPPILDSCLCVCVCARVCVCVCKSVCACMCVCVYL